MVNRWEWLISNATLDVVDFNIHFRGGDFCEKNRVFPFYVMSYVKEGRAEATFHNQVIQHLPGTLLIIPPGVHHAHCVPAGAPNTMFLWWHFNLTIGGVLDIMRLISPPNCLHVKNTGAFEDVFVQYVDLFSQKPTIPNIIMKRAKGLEVMAYLLENILSAVPDQNLHLPGIPDAFFEMLMMLTEHPETNVSLKELSERYYMNPTYISNRFKRLFGMTPIKLQHNLLIARAKSLLSGEGKGVSCIASELGFPDVSSFTRFFTKREGISPTHYRDSSH